MILYSIEKKRKQKFTHLIRVHQLFSVMFPSRYCRQPDPWKMTKMIDSNFGIILQQFALASGKCVHQPHYVVHRVRSTGVHVSIHICVEKNTFGFFFYIYLKLKTFESQQEGCWRCMCLIYDINVCKVCRNYNIFL